jgi:hypothetical protein
MKLLEKLTLSITSDFDQIFIILGGLNEIFIIDMLRTYLTTTDCTLDAFQTLSSMNWYVRCIDMMVI